jgi:hypothetical protein
MRSVRLLLAVGASLLLIGCARTSRLIREDENVYELRARELQREVVASLKAKSWTVTDNVATVAMRRGEGRHAIVLTIRYDDLGNQSAFSLDATSKHSFDWLTFGALGHKRLPIAEAAGRTWFDEFRAAHAAEAAPTAPAAPQSR